MRNDDITAIGVLGFYFIYIVGIILGLIGWIMNLFVVVKALLHNAEFTTLLIGRIIGIFAFPLGALLGWF